MSDTTHDAPADESGEHLFVVDDTAESSATADAHEAPLTASDDPAEGISADDGTPEDEPADAEPADAQPADMEAAPDHAVAEAANAGSDDVEAAPDHAVAEAANAGSDDVEAAQAAGEADLGEVAPALPAAFGLVFQAPEPLPARRRASRPAGATTRAPHQTTEAPAQDGAGDREHGRHEPETVPAAQDAGSEPDSTESAEDDDATQARARRRRGGRGRRPRAEDGGAPDKGAAADQPTLESAGAPEAGGAAAAESDAEGDASQEASTPHTEDGEEQESTARRRRRRRRGSASDNDDPPGTVTRVREPRRERDEVASVKGSTRLEAKKQRRREGREAGRRRTIITEKEFLARRESVERTMVVRRRDGRTQIGVLEDGVLVEHYVSRTTNASMAGNIYLGRVQNVLPSMEAAFVDIGRGRNAVLYAGEVNWDVAGLETGEAKRIENVLSSGESVLVQVTKDPIGHKGARLTSQISLPGRYLVYVPQGSMTGISRKLPDTERSRLKAILKQIVPADAGVIVRTAAEGASEEELRRDVERLAKTWEKVSKAVASKSGKKGGAPVLLNSEPDLTVRVIRDVFNEDFASLVVSGDEVWDEISEYVEDVAPDLASRMTKWTSEQDIFTAHRVDEQLAKALDRKVYLPSGGSLVIDRTEAMTVIDVNTGKFVGSGGNLEETVTKNNLEAAEEIVRQLRLRDLGGIIVIDFIDMVLESNRDLVVRRLLECLGRDRTKHQVAEVTSLGLVQMTRKRVASGLLEVFSETCECCAGRGVIVRSTPVDAPAESADHERGPGHGEPASGAQTSGGSSRSRRGRGQQAEDAQAAETPARSGPSAAKIAAAAHAAALKANGHGEAHDAPAGEPGLTPADELAELLVAPAEPHEQASADDQAGTTDRPEESAAGSPASDSGALALAGDETPAENTTGEADATASAAESAAPRSRAGRRRRGRATAPAGPPRAAAEQAD